MGVPAASPALSVLQIPIPAFYLCPISLDLMTDPVTLSSGQTFDRHSIQRWLDDGHATCPVTRLPVNADGEDLIPNHALRRLIQAWCVQNKSAGVQRIHTPRQPPSLRDIPSLLDQVRLHHAAPAAGGPRRLSSSSSAAAAALQKLCVLASDRPKARLLLLRAGAPRALSLFLSEWLPLCKRPSAPPADVEDALHLLAILAEETEVALHAAFAWEPACRDEVFALARTISDPQTKLELRRDAAVVLSKSAASFECARGNLAAMEGFMNAVVGLVREAPKDAMANLRYGSSTSSPVEHFSVAGLHLLHFVCKSPTRNRYYAIDAGAMDALATLVRNVRPDASARPSSGQVRTIELSLKVWECLCKCAEGRATTHQSLGLLAGLMCNVSERASKYCILIIWLLLKFAPIGSPLARQLVETGCFVKVMAIAQGNGSLKTRSLASKLANTLSCSMAGSRCNNLKLE